MEFEHVRIDDHPPCGRLGFCETPDLTGNGEPDILVGGMGSAGEIDVLGKHLKLRLLPVTGDLIKWREWNVFWYENPGWERHDVAKAPDLSVGASMVDLDGDGADELVVGQNMGTELYWFDPPTDPREEWTRYLITDEFRKYHDTAVGDLDGDGEPELAILSQKSGVVCYYDMPDDPRQTPWPSDLRHVIADDLTVEGAAIADLDGDGHQELVAGANVLSRNGEEGWTRRSFGTDWAWTRLALADVNGDGRDEIVMTEGDLPFHGDRGGRVGVVDTESWAVDVIDRDLFNPHTLQVGDLTGNGYPDLVVGEMGLGERSDPGLYVYRNADGETFDRQEIDRGVPTHEAKLVDLTGDGRLDIAGKSYGPDTHVDVWYRRD